MAVQRGAPRQRSSSCLKAKILGLSRSLAHSQLPKVPQFRNREIDINPIEKVMWHTMRRVTPTSRKCFLKRVASQPLSMKTTGYASFSSCHLNPLTAPKLLNSNVNTYARLFQNLTPKPTLLKKPAASRLSPQPSRTPNSQSLVMRYVIPGLKY